MNVPVKRLNDGETDYFPMGVLDSVFLNKDVEVKTTVGGLSKGTTLKANLSLQKIFDKILTIEGTDIDELAKSKVDKETGKGLSTCDFTLEYKQKVEKAITEHQDISSKVDKIEGKGLSTNDLTDSRLTILNNAITEHQDISGKVDKITGKGLSTNDFTDGEKIKLDNLHNYDDTYVRTEIERKVNKSDIASKLSDLSVQPVQNKVIKAALDTKPDKYLSTDTADISTDDKLKETLKNILIKLGMVESNITL